MIAGRYRVLPSPSEPTSNSRWIRLGYTWECGDGCCSDTEYEEVDIPVGTELWIDTFSFGEFHHGDDWGQFYRPDPDIDYVAKGYLEPVT